MSSYRPQAHGSRYHDVPPPPPPGDLPPLPPGPPPPYNYGGAMDSWRPPDRYHGDFAFRNTKNAPDFARERDSYRPGQHPRGRPRRLERTNDRRNLNPGRRPPIARHGQGPRITSARPLLSWLHAEDAANQEVLGVTDSSAKYMNVDEIASSEEADMEESESEIDSDNIRKQTMDGAAEDSDTDRPSKRVNLGDGKAAPKWSNPDPYFLLPPTDDTIGKRKDPVETIRKYRKAEADKLARSNEVAANDDFISFDFGDNAANNDSDEAEASAQIFGAPTAPRAMNGRSQHQQNGIHNDVQPETQLDHLIDPSDRKRKRENMRNGLNSMGGSNLEIGLQPQWWPEPNTNPVPWLRPRNHVVVNPGFRLHLEICDFYDFVRPRRPEQEIRADLLYRLQDLVQSTIPKCTVRCFGSFAAGLYLPNSDMDVVLLSDYYRDSQVPLLCQNKKQIYNFAHTIRRSGIAKHESVEVIPSAKVPLVKFVDKISRLRVDVSFENDSGIRALDTFQGWKKQFPAMPILVTLIKQFLLMRGLNEVQHGGIGGFSVTCLVTSLLQNMPRVQNGSMIPEEHLGEILLEFLDLYGNRFDVSRSGIQMEPPGYFDKKSYMRSSFGPLKSQPDRLAIIDPNRPENDISGGSKNIMSIFDHFGKAHTRLLEAMKSPKRPSLLDWMLGGNYAETDAQRGFLRNLQSRTNRSLDHQAKGSLTGHDVVADERRQGEPTISASASSQHVTVLPTQRSAVTQNLASARPGQEHVHQDGESHPTVSNPQDGMTERQKTKLKKAEKRKLPSFEANEQFADLARAARSRALKKQYPEYVDRVPERLEQAQLVRLSVQFEEERAANHSMGAPAPADSTRKPLKDADSKQNVGSASEETLAKSVALASLDEAPGITSSEDVSSDLAGSSHENPIDID